MGLFYRKLLLKKNTTSTVYKSPMKKPNRNQAHLVANQQETKLSKPTMSSHLKQKEPMAIKKSLLSKPIIMAKSAGKTDGTSLVPCKPAGLKRPAQKLNGTKDHPLQLATMPGHSTPIKDQTSRRRSVAVSPQRDSSAANDDRQAIPAKQRRRSGIPLPGGVVRNVYSLAEARLQCRLCFSLLIVEVMCFSGPTSHPIPLNVDLAPLH